VFRPRCPHQRWSFDGPVLEVAIVDTALWWTFPLWRRQAPCKDGVMIKLTFCLRRKADVSAEEFYRYWKDEHGPLVRDRAEVLGLRKYQQVHTLDEPELHAALQRRNGGAPAPFDGIAEVWVDDVETFRGGGGTPEARQAAKDLIEDEARFIDLPNSPMWLAEEIVFYER
jgi:uncharacterized protein (TIGR02118 family)